jgi:hypothetical protein
MLSGGLPKGWVLVVLLNRGWNSGGKNSSSQRPRPAATELARKRQNIGVSLSASQSAGRATSRACLINSNHHNESGCSQELVSAGNYTLSESGTFPPFSASLIITCLCSQIFMSAELAISPV